MSEPLHADSPYGRPPTLESAERLPLLRPPSQAESPRLEPDQRPAPYTVERHKPTERGKRHRRRTHFRGTRRQRLRAFARRMEVSICLIALASSVLIGIAAASLLK